MKVENLNYKELVIEFLMIAERKVLASIQRRKGPNVTGFWGTLQAIADGLKLIFKEVVIPVRSNWILFLAAPSITLLIGLLIWVFIPFSDINYLTNFDFNKRKGGNFIDIINIV